MTCARRKRRLTALWRILVLPAVLWLASCGGRGGQIPVLGAVTIELSTQSITSPPTIFPGGTLVISATVYDPSNGGVTWTSTPLTFGGLSNATANSVTYTAPPSFAVPTTVIITATSVTNPNVTASMQISATPIGLLLVAPGTQASFFLDVPLADQTISPGGTMLVGADMVGNTSGMGVTWNLSPPNAGSITVLYNGPNVFQANYTAPGSISSPTTATLSATSDADSNATGTVRITVLPGGGPTVAAIQVDGGPVPDQIYPNGAFINGVVICNPGSVVPTFLPVCQSVDGILVDTGSYGLRILQSQIPLLSLPTLTDLGAGNANNILENCYAFADGSFVWGPASRADVYIAGQEASSYISGISKNASIVQVISSTSTGIPDGCSNGGTALNTAQLLGANGILGIGPEPTDCTLAGVNYCDGSVQPVAPNLYYSCPKSGCGTADNPVLVSSNLQQQITNLLPLFGQQGVIIDLPSDTAAEPTISGTLTFAATLSGATIYTLDSNGNFSTTYQGQNLTNSFLDSGSSALYFPDSLPTCNVSVEFFCPSALTPLSAVNQGKTQGQGTVNFSVDNADNLFSTYPGFAVFPTVAGPSGGPNGCSNGVGACTFDWGLPFFYGRPVLTKLDACPPPPNSCTELQAGWWAF